MTELLTHPIALLVIVGAVVRLALWIGKVEEQRGTVPKLLAEIRDELKRLADRIPAVAIARGSPRQLTDLGREMANYMNAYDWAIRNAPDLAPGTAEKVEFEVDELSRQAVQKAFDSDDDFRRTVSDCAYEFGLDQEVALAVVAIVLRDELLV